ncbi:ICMT-domain-containing protein [Pilatotrama ljubarskyi]|nr:ICMT-domain-containing protein [Pilatotrama ljubarskyi]
MAAEWVAYFPPNARPKAEEMSAFGEGHAVTRNISAAIRVGLACSWSICACEIAALLTKDAHAPAASAALSFLFKDPSSAQRLTLSRQFLLGLLSLICGAALRKWCYRALGRHFTFELALLKEHKLVTSGPYAFVRHPSYTGVLAALGGTLAMELAPGGWLRESGVLGTALGRVAVAARVAGMVGSCVGIVKRVRKEDEVLRKEFGKQWEEWVRRVPYALIPYVY